MNVKVKIYNGLKYNKDTEVIDEISYYYIKDYEVVTGEKAAAVVNLTDGEFRDEYNEYLIIYLNDNETATFRNSHVDLFRL